MGGLRIAFVGLGGMGGGMACRLAESGFPMAVYNRTASKADEVAGLGARVASSPADAAAEADMVLLSLADESVVEQLLYGSDGGALQGLKPGGLVVDMSTVSPDFARASAARGKEAGYRVLDATVLGNPFHARSGDLRVMVGGDADDYAEGLPVFEALGKQVLHVGTNGMGASMKLVLNLLMGIQMPAMAEALVFGEALGLTRQAMLSLINGSGYSSPVMNFRCDIIEKRAFDFAAFKLGLMRKDVMLVLEEAHKHAVPMPVSEAAYSMLTAAKQQGLGDLDVSAIVAFQERLAGSDTYPWPV
ncbi:MAG: 3-hydroxyisobutyrate dehydrogenase [Acidimicrobiaceae bacterium]|nr:3-hydroxyisobutyrate dehydrogenase [Acidimicrobiaceae bacterium]